MLWEAQGTVLAAACSGIPPRELGAGRVAQNYLGKSGWDGCLG